jgi:hypothetical protein
LLNASSLFLPNLAFLSRSSRISSPSLDPTTGLAYLERCRFCKYPCLSVLMGQISDRVRKASVQQFSLTTFQHSRLSRHFSYFPSVF